jgi:hypothetical protein
LKAVDSAPGDHHIGIFPHDEARGIADRMGAGRAGGHHRMIRALEAVFDRNLTRGEVDEAGRDKERRDAARTLLL